MDLVRDNVLYSSKLAIVFLFDQDISILVI